ncbi:HD domain-containing protein [Chloroflexota bacterium]
MRISKGLILQLFSGANIQRWNDKIRHVELTELDKQAHKMMIAYVLGKDEQDNPDFNWIEIIEGGIFDYLQRTELTDIKPTILDKIKENKDQYIKLNKWVFDRLNPVITPLGEDFKKRYREYFKRDEESLSRKILNAAHYHATSWEYDLIQDINTKDTEAEDIRTSISKLQDRYKDLKSIQGLKNSPNLKTFIDLCGQLRFQLRWGHVRRLTRTSVLGHMFIVAILSYLCSCQTGICMRRRINNFFTGLFHDLPETLTRDIISPVKGSVEGINKIVKEYEKEQMRTKIYSIIPSEWHSEMKMFAEDEFSDLVTIEGVMKSTTPGEINKLFNDDIYNPRDGTLIKACDHLAAFTEAYLALVNGATAEEFQEAKHSLRDKYRNKNISRISFGSIYADFE